MTAQSRSAKIVNGPAVWSASARGVQFTVTEVTVRYFWASEAGKWIPERFGAVRAFGYREDGRADERRLRPPTSADWYYGIVTALTPEPVLPEFDMKKEIT